MGLTRAFSDLVCRHGVTGDCGLCSGERTRAEAARTGRPVAYQVAIELGWRWAVSDAASVLHLVHPHGDRTKCGRILPRAERLITGGGVERNGCRRCKVAVGIGSRL